MNAFNALLFIVGLMATLVSIVALFNHRLRPRAIRTLKISSGVVLLALVMLTMERPHTVQEAASPPATPPTPHDTVVENAPGLPGTARVCLEDDELHLPAEAKVILPATSILEDDGPLTGPRDDPANWGYEVKEGFKRPAAIITLAPAILRAPSRCADVPVKMFLDSLWTETTQKSLDSHVFTIVDVLNYPIPKQKPPVEIGRLIDDIGVKAILLTDVNASMPSPKRPLGEEARTAACLEGARTLAAQLGGGVGKASSVTVQLGGIAAHAAAYGCATDGKDAPDLFVSWDGQARPSAAIKALIGKGGAFLTGATSAEIINETTACVNAALRPNSDEGATNEFRGVRIECTAFARDGGAGSVTVYRRFGASPFHAQASPSELAAVDRASDAIRAKDEQSAAQSLSFAKWWEDPTISKDVKTFAMMSARLITLKERCPSAKPYEDKIAGWAASAGVAPSDIEPGGQYYALMTSMIFALRADAQKSSVADACASAQQYD